MNTSYGPGEELKTTVYKYSDSVLKLAFTYLKNRADAEDIAQDVFLAYLQKRPRFDMEVKKKAWLLKVTANKCRNKLKSGWNKYTEAITYDLSYMQKEEAGVLSFVLHLDEKYRIPIHLHYYEGYSLGEIAMLMGSKAATVGTWLSRGRALLKSMLGDDFYD